MKISVIIPAYNAEKVILNAVNSVLNNSYRNLEVIVVNDGSKDKAAELAQRASEKDQRVRLIQKQNGGVSSARNLGIQEAKGEILMFLDSDDTFEQGYCSSVIKRFLSERADIVMVGYNEIYGRNITKVFCPIEESLSTQDEIYEKLIIGCYSSGINGYMGSVWLAGFKKEIIVNHHIQFNSNIHHAEDKLFLLEYLFCCRRLSVINEALYNYYLGDASTTKNYSHSLRKNNEMYSNEINKLFLENNRRFPENIIYQSAITEVFSIIINEARANNPNNFFTQIKTVALSNQGLKEKIYKFKPTNRTLKIKRIISMHSSLCIIFYLVRRIQRKMGVAF